MSNKLPPYRALAQHFPAEINGEKMSAEEVKKMIGGNVDADYITNTCTIRISRALNGAGAPIPSNFTGMVTVRGADNLRYALRVREFRLYMQATYGQAPYSVSGGRVADSFRGVAGIIMFDVRGWSDASGHVDLWDGEQCAYRGYWVEAFEVSLWPAPMAAVRASLLHLQEHSGGL